MKRDASAIRRGVCPNVCRLACGYERIESVYNFIKTKGMNDVFSVGRVQTPTLALIVRREKEIEQFRPEPFWEVVATFDVNGKRYEGKWWHENETRTYDQQLAEKVSAFCRGKQVEIEEVTCERKRFYHRFCLIYQHYKQQPTSDLDIHHKNA